MRGGLLWDDAAHVTRPDLRGVDGLRRIWTEPRATQQYYPLLHSAFWVEHRLWGDDVVGYHAINVALHALSACLLVLIVRRLGLPGAWIAGALFALHPMAVEAVAWISEQKSALSGVLYFGAALAYLDFDESRRRTRYAAALALFALALAAKTVTATLPGALLVAIWWGRGRLEWRRDVLPLAPWLAMGAAAGLVTAWVERTMIGAAGPDFALAWWQRIALAGRAVCFYAAKAVWPVGLTFFYPRWTIELWQLVFPAAVLAAAWVARRHRGALAALLVFGGSLFPALGFFDVYPFRYAYVADHFAYLALAAIVVPAAALLSRVRPAGAVAAAILGVLTWQQAGEYRNEETLYRATIARNPAAWLAHNNLGNLLIERAGSREEAVAHIEEAVRLKPDFWEAHLSLGNALLDRSPAEALRQYRIAVQLAPGSERAHTNLGNALLGAGRTDEAISELQAALRIDPNQAEARNDLGNALASLGRWPEAMAEYRAAIGSNSEFAEPHNNLGRALAQAGRLPEAVAEFETAIRLNPGSWSAHSNLGNALSAMPNRLPDAIAEYQAALRLRPDSAAAHNNLGYALSRMPDRLADATAEYREALRLDPNSADAHYNLGEALLRTPGREREALGEFEAVLRLKPVPQVQQIVNRLRARK